MARVYDLVRRGELLLGQLVLLDHLSLLRREVGLGQRINMGMQAGFYYLSGVLPVDEALERAKHEVDVEYKSYKEHHSSSNMEQMSAISDLKLTVDRLSDQVEKKSVEKKKS